MLELIKYPKAEVNIFKTNSINITTKNYPHKRKSYIEHRLILERIKIAS